LGVSVALIRRGNIVEDKGTEMPTFDYTFIVDAPQTTVAAFHHDTRVLKTLTPPPIFVQVHSFEPLGEGSMANFTLWFGPFPVHWKAIHTNVSENGFTDIQARGPLKRWQHAHHFSAVSDEVTLVSEHIDYEYAGGIKGLLSRLMYSEAALYLLFTARKIITRRKIVEKNV
jgi:ligand-binding SRPBCC domain-containing protein